MGYGTWVVIGWYHRCCDYVVWVWTGDIYRSSAYSLSCNTLWAHVTHGNSYHLQRPRQSLTQPYFKFTFTISASFLKQNCHIFLAIVQNISLTQMAIYGVINVKDLLVWCPFPPLWFDCEVQISLMLVQQIIGDCHAVIGTYFTKQSPS